MSSLPSASSSSSSSSAAAAVPPQAAADAEETTQAGVEFALTALTMGNEQGHAELGEKKEESDDASDPAAVPSPLAASSPMASSAAPPAPAPPMIQLGVARVKASATWRNGVAVVQPCDINAALQASAQEAKLIQEDAEEKRRRAAAWLANSAASGGASASGGVEFVFGASPGPSVAAASFASAAAAVAPPSEPFAFKLGAFGSSASPSSKNKTSGNRPARKSNTHVSPRPAATSSAAHHRPLHHHRHSHEAHSAASSTSAAASFGGPSLNLPAEFNFGAASAKDEDALTSAGRVHLYRHALECVFAFLPLRELGRVLCVSREWAAAVERMKPTLAHACSSSRVMLDVGALLRSRLARHVGQLGDLSPRVVHASPGHLEQITTRCTALHTLHIFVSELDGLFPSLPPRLRKLELHYGGRDSDFLGVLEAIGGVSSLETLILPRLPRTVSLEPLGAVPHLTNVELVMAQHDRLSDEQIAQLGTKLSHLHRMCVVEGIARRKDALLALLLTDPEPHHLQWRDIGVLHDLNQVGASLLPRLPTLTRLHLTDVRLDSMSFLAHLPALTSLRLVSVERNDTLVPSLVATAVNNGMRGLQEFRLWDCLLSDTQMDEILIRMPQLRVLELADLLQVRTLGALPPTLEELCLFNLSREGNNFDEFGEPTGGWLLAPDRLEHVVSRCPLLRVLCLSRVLPLDAFARRPFEQRPSPVLPHLEVFDYDAPVVKRKGQSDSEVVRALARQSNAATMGFKRKSTALPGR